MSTFALVHGAWHGGWCWERLAPELERRGHDVVAPDLPCDDPDALFDDYAAVVVDALARAGDDVVVVGHSLGGHTIPLVAARRPVRRLVFVCAVIAQPGASFADQLRAESDMFVPGYEAGLAAAGERPLREWASYEIARATLYPDCAEADARAAFARLRPQASTPYFQPCSLTAFPAVPAAYVIGADDRIVRPSWSRRAAAERLGVPPVELPGGHSPFLAQPEALAEILAAQAA